MGKSNRTLVMEWTSTPRHGVGTRYRLIHVDDYHSRYIVESHEVDSLGGDAWRGLEDLSKPADGEPDVAYMLAEVVRGLIKTSIKPDPGSL